MDLGLAQNVKLFLRESLGLTQNHQPPENGWFYEDPLKGSKRL